MRRTTFIVLAALAMFLAANFVYAQDTTAAAVVDESKQPAAVAVVEEPKQQALVPESVTPVVIDEPKQVATQEPAAPVTAEEPKLPVPALSAGEAETTQWLWGQVISVDPANNKLLLNYLDYENDTEKQLEITVNEKTKYTNFQALVDLKPQDAVSLDYAINTEGKPVAKGINLEKPDEPQVAAVPSEAAPQAVTP